MNEIRLCGKDCHSCTFAVVNFTPNVGSYNTLLKNCINIDSIVVRDGACITAYSPFQQDSSFCRGDDLPTWQKIRARAQTLCSDYVLNDETIQIVGENNPQNVLKINMKESPLEYTFSSPNVLNIRLDMTQSETSANKLFCDIGHFKLDEGYLRKMHTVHSTEDIGV